MSKQLPHKSSRPLQSCMAWHNWLTQGASEGVQNEIITSGTYKEDAFDWLKSANSVRQLSNCEDSSSKNQFEASKKHYHDLCRDLSWASAHGDFQGCCYWARGGGEQEKEKESPSLQEHGGQPCRSPLALHVSLQLSCPRRQ
eukprot:1148473-Pelagomonas_calceolata.AAC.1